MSSLINSSVNSEILDQLKCPTCLNYMTEIIYECVSGHSICDGCSRSERCPICNGGITDIRNHTLEHISHVVFYPCVNDSYGCNQQFKLREWKEHVPFCEYRRYTCKLDRQCEWEGSKKEIKSHSLANHEVGVMIGRECITFWNNTKPEHEVKLMLAYKEQFYVHRRLRNGIMYWGVQYVGRQEDIILYCFQILIFTDQYSNRNLMFSEICHDDIKEDIDEITDTGFCVAVPLPVLQTYLNGDNAVFYKIRIKKA